MSEKPRDWIFTFGYGHEHHGEPYHNKFVRIHGTFESARAEMVERYGRRWSMQYPNEKEAGVREWNLEEVK